MKASELKEIKNFYYDYNFAKDAVDVVMWSEFASELNDKIQDLVEYIAEKEGFELEDE